MAPNLPSVILALCATAPAQDPQAPAPHAVVGVTVVDVEAGTLLPERTVLLEQGRIARIAPAAEVQLAPGMAQVDGTGLYLMPGLFDCHVHYLDAEVFGRLLLANGVLCVREMGGATEQTLALRDALNRGERLGPEMVAAGAIVDGKPPVWPFSEACATPEEGRAAVRRLAHAGVDFIKVYSKLERDTWRAVVAEAHALGLKAVGHIPETVTLDEALEARMDGAEHLMGLEKLLGRLAGAEVHYSPDRPWEDLSLFAQRAAVPRATLLAELRKIAAAGMVHCPTLVVMEGIAALDAAEPDPLLKYAPPFLRAFWEQGGYRAFAPVVRAALPHMQALAADLHAAGVTLVCGSDLANPNVIAGFSLHREMELLQQAGVPPADALRAATIHAARLCGVAERLGSVAPGKAANLVLVRGDPLADVRRAHDIAGVFLRGRWLDAAALEALRAEAEQRVQGAAADVADMALEIPGELVHSGRYALRFGGADAGVEKFAITRSESGWHPQARMHPSGGWDQPYQVVMHGGPDFRFRSGAWRRLQGHAPAARYALEDGAVVARMQREGGETETVRLPLPADAVVTAAVFSADFLTLQGAGLQPGESRSLASIELGSGGWKPRPASLELRREPDAELERAGVPVAARRYRATVTNPDGPAELDIWTGQDGVVLRVAIRMAFGRMEAELL
ncbi:MAG: hypothetical protein EYC70_05575 [Planctomycetota bacterium]|nr:MAG: hypothetical protein EYC70_05575 [Planctomycetota bacterium]